MREFVKKLITIAEEIARGNYSDEIMNLTRDEYPHEIRGLAEAMGLLMVKLEGREYRLMNAIAELEEAKRLLLKENIPKAQDLETLKAQVASSGEANYAVLLAYGHNLMDIDPDERFGRDRPFFERPYYGQVVITAMMAFEGFIGRFIRCLLRSRQCDEADIDRLISTQKDRNFMEYILKDLLGQALGESGFSRKKFFAPHWKSLARFIEIRNAIIHQAPVRLQELLPGENGMITRGVARECLAQVKMVINDVIDRYSSVFVPF
ncbi:MAG: hypothetical protein HQK59_17170 [Deltaproteobacteria bacterium]|nr:hypothetical protein [Deltaproteobacteria bacterium]